MKKLILIFIILSLIGCKKETVEIPGKDVLVYTSSDYEGSYYFIGTIDGKQIVINESNQLGYEIIPHPTESKFIYKEQSYVFQCHGNSVTVNFLKSFSDSLVTEEQKLSIYELGEIPFGDLTNGTDGFVISYRETQTGVLWSSDNGAQTGSLPLITSLGISYEPYGLRRVRVFIDCMLYNKDGDVKHIAGDLATSVVLR